MWSPNRSPGRYLVMHSSRRAIDGSTPMTYVFSVVFVETSLFTRLLGTYLSDEEYAALQSYLIAHPEGGAILRGSGGIRKVR